MPTAQTFENMQVLIEFKDNLPFFKLADIEKVLGLSVGVSR